MKTKKGKDITGQDMLEVTAHLACMIGQAWETFYHSDFVATRLSAIDYAAEFLENFWSGEDDDYLDQLDEFFETKMDEDT